jgi:ketosteroid isomerase-like protein
MNPGQPPTKGKEAARATLKAMLSDPAFKLTFEIGKVEVARSGDIGYAAGPYQLTYTDPVTSKVINCVATTPATSSFSSGWATTRGSRTATGRSSTTATNVTSSHP